MSIFQYNAAAMGGPPTPSPPIARPAAGHRRWHTNDTHGHRKLPFSPPTRRAVLRGQRQRDSSLWNPFLRLRGGRSYADGAKGTCPFGIPFSAAAGMGALLPLNPYCFAHQKDGGRNGKGR